MQLKFKSVVNSNGNEFITEYSSKYTEDTENDAIVLTFLNDKNKTQIIKVSNEAATIQDDNQIFDLKLNKYCLIHYLVEKNYINFYSYLKKIVIDFNEIMISYDLVDNIENKNILASIEILIHTN